MKLFLLLLLCASYDVLPLARSYVGRQPFTIMIEAEKPDLKSGSEVWIRVRLTNTGDRDLDMSGGFSDTTGLDPNYHFDVRDARGKLIPKRVYLHPELDTGRPVNRTVKPQQTLIEDQRVSASYDMRRPGKYIIKVSRRASDNPKDGRIESNALTITIVP